MSLPDIDTSKVVVVRWWDAVGTECHYSNIHNVTLATNTTIGVIVDENDTRTVIVTESSDTGECSITVIPTGWIQSREYPATQEST